MARASDWNTKIIEEFRGNHGQVGRHFIGHGTGAAWL